MKLSFDTGFTRSDFNRYIYYSIAALLLIVIHMTILDFIAIGNITPDLLIILIVIISLNEGQFRAVFAGFFIGLLFDLLTMDVIGTNALTKTVVAFVAGYFYREGEAKKIIGSYKFLIIVLITALIHNAIYYVFYLKLSEASYLVFFLKYGVAAAMYTTIIAIFPMLFRISRK